MVIILDARIFHIFANVDFTFFFVNFIRGFYNNSVNIDYDGYHGYNEWHLCDMVACFIFIVIFFY